MSVVRPPGWGQGEQLSELLRTMPLATAVLDRDLRYVAHNAEWLHVHGLHEPRDLVGQRHQDVFPDEAPAWRERFARCIARGETESGVDSLPGSGAVRELVRWSAMPSRVGREITGVLVYAERATDQALAEKRLAERDRLIRDLFEHAPIGLNLCRMDGLWLESNPAFLEIIGYSRAEADGGLTYWQLTPRKYDEDEAHQLELLRTMRRYGPYEKEFIHKDGRLVPVRLHGFLVQREGEDYIWSLIEDLTAQRALEAKVEEERLMAIQASKLAVMGEMAASFAHEINNPLGVIDAYAFALAQGYDTGDRAFVDEALKAIREATARAGKIVHGLRRFARVDREDHIDEIAVTALIDDALDLCRARIRAHGVELVVDVQATGVVRGYALELSQVLVNLLNNAFDATRDASTRWIRLEAHDGGSDKVTIAVEDSGPGIPADIEANIFRPFFTTKPVGVGTGLGLSISRNIVERHQGTLVLDRSSNHTRFVVTLPR